MMAPTICFISVVEVIRRANNANMVTVIANIMDAGAGPPTRIIDEPEAQPTRTAPIALIAYLIRAFSSHAIDNIAEETYAIPTEAAAPSIPYWGTNR